MTQHKCNLRFCAGQGGRAEMNIVNEIKPDGTLSSFFEVRKGKRRVLKTDNYNTAATKWNKVAPSR